MLSICSGFECAKIYSNLWFRGILSGLTSYSPTDTGSILSLLVFFDAI